MTGGQYADRGRGMQSIHPGRSGPLATASTGVHAWLSILCGAGCGLVLWLAVSSTLLPAASVPVRRLLELQAWGLGLGALGLGALPALTMGCLASLMLAMVTRVSCGHSGRALVADRIAWSLFWLLQAATVLRIAAAVPGVPGVALPWLLLLAAGLWAGTMGAWGVRLGRWYGCLRADGRPG